MRSRLVDLFMLSPTSRVLSFRQAINGHMFLEQVLSIETIQVHQTNIELKRNLNIFKDDFSSMTDPLISTPITLKLLV